MVLARIDGFLTASITHSSLSGQKIVICTPINESGKATGAPFASLDPIGGGLHAKVFITTDGSCTQRTVGDGKSPIRNQVMGILD